MTHPSDSKPEWWDSVPEADRTEYLRIWEAAAADPVPVDVDRDWARVQARISRSSSVRMGWYAAAAVLFLAAFAGLYRTQLATRMVEAPLGAVLTLELPDGTTADLNAGARLSYSPFGFGWWQRDVRLTGEAYFEVESDSTRPFTVTTHNAHVHVTGTRFNIRAWPDDPTAETTLFLEEGQVDFSSIARPDTVVRLAPGFVSRVDTTRQVPTEPVAWDTRITAWRHGGLLVRERSLTLLLAELERRYPGQVTLADPALATLRVSVYLERDATVEAVLRALRTANGELEWLRAEDGRYRIQGELRVRELPRVALN